MSRIPSALTFKSFHLSTKSGPNGPENALWTSLRDITALPLTLIASLRILGGPKLSHRMDVILSKCDSVISANIGLVLVRWYQRYVWYTGTSFRKLTWFPDRESKVRVIAIGDYFSQTALKPLHDYLFKVLSKIPQDCTFSQSSFKDKIVGWDTFHSVDLTAATDRFPITFISMVLGGLLPQNYITAWLDIMVGYPFDYKTDQVSYSVGNPMGFYSS